jgi:hypothetical protein
MTGKSFIEEFTFEDPQDPEWPDTYRVAEVETDSYSNGKNDVRWIINVGDGCGSLSVHRGEAERYIEILKWIQGRELATAPEPSDAGGDS